MKKIYFLFIILNSAVTMKSSADQYAGGSITYTNLGGYQYKISLFIYRDCAGGSSSPLSINASSSCGNNLTLTAQLVSSSTINTFCSGQLTTCQGGITPGIQKYEYDATVTLPNGCSDWIFSFTGTYRNNAITTIASPSTTKEYIEAHLNNMAFQNNSVQYSNEAIFFACVGQNTCFNLGAADPDADSLVYSLISPRVTSITPVTYDGPNTYSNPLPSFPPLNLNASTGQICMNPTSEAVALMTVLVQEYRAGVIVGQTMRDIEIYARNCIDHPPILSGINILGTGIQQISNDTIAECNTVKTYFNILSSDSDSNDLLSMTVDRGNVPGISNPTISGNPPTLYWDFETVPPGVYTFSVTVKDNHCPSSDSTTKTYTVIVGLVTNISSTPYTCSGQYGTATVTAEGSGSYQYSWNNGATTSSISNLSSGNYSVTVNDLITGCSSTQNVSVPTSYYYLSLFSSQQTTCGHPNGSATVDVNGGTPPYSYLWNNGQTTSSCSGIYAGTYSVTVTDDNGCIRTNSVTVAPPAGTPYATMNSTLTGCTVPTGTASASVSGGSPPYSYLWNNGQTTSTANLIGAGTYTVTISDTKSCSTNGIVTVNNQAGPTLFVPQANVTCPGGSNGIASATAIGISPFTYFWSNGETTANDKGLIAGTYTVTVTDSVGCTTSQTVTITEPSGSPISISGDSLICRGQLVTLTASGGTMYNWSSGETTDTIMISPLTTTVYEVTGQTGGCLETISFSVIVNSCGALPKASYQASDSAFCQYQCINFFDLSKGNPISWYWLFPGAIPDTSSQENPINICYSTAGTFPATLIVNNSNGCDTLTFNNYIRVYPVPPPPLITKSNDTLYCSVDPSYISYQWYKDTTLISGATGTFITNIQGGNYNVSVTNDNGCSIAVGINIILDISPLLSGDAAGIRVFPNPAKDQLYIMGNSVINKGSIIISDLLGQTIYNQELETPNSKLEKVIDISTFANGVYIIMVNSGDKIYLSKVEKNDKE